MERRELEEARRNGIIELASAALVDDVARFDAAATTLGLRGDLVATRLVVRQGVLSERLDAWRERAREAFARGDRTTGKDALEGAGRDSVSLTEDEEDDAVQEALKRKMDIETLRLVGSDLDSTAREDMLRAAAETGEINYQAIRDMEREWGLERPARERPGGRPVDLASVAAEQSAVFVVMQEQVRELVRSLQSKMQAPGGRDGIERTEEYRRLMAIGGRARANEAVRGDLGGQIALQMEFRHRFLGGERGLIPSKTERMA